MQQDYWLGRQRTSFLLAQQASSAEERLTHYHDAGLHSLKAVAAAVAGTVPIADVTPATLSSSAEADARYYRELAEGAAYLASNANDAAEAAKHDRWASNYARRAREAIFGKGPES